MKSVWSLYFWLCLFLTNLHLCASDASVLPVPLSFKIYCCVTHSKLQTLRVSAPSYENICYIIVTFMRQTLLSFVKSSFELTFPKASQDAQLQENNFESKRHKDLFRLHLLAQSFLTSHSTAVHCVRKLPHSSFVSAFKNSTCP